MTKPEFINYLETTLIPDLKEGGSEATAQDFEQCIQFMRPSFMDVRIGYPTIGECAIALADCFTDKYGMVGQIILESALQRATGAMYLKYVLKDSFEQVGLNDTPRVIEANKAIKDLTEQA
jgi:hypothetical protein